MLSLHTARRLKLDVNVDSVAPTVVHRACAVFSRPYITGRSVLNAGCWVGNYEILVSPFVKGVIGIDIEYDALRIAKQASPSIEFLHASVMSMPFQDGSFDVVSMWEVIEHLPEGSEGRALTNIRQVLKPEGYLLLSTPNYHWAYNLLDPAFYLIGHRHYSVEGLESMLSLAGFTVKKVEVKGGFFYAMSVILFYTWKHLLKMRFPRVQWLETIVEKEFCYGGFADIFLVARKSP